MIAVTTASTFDADSRRLASNAANASAKSAFAAFSLSGMGDLLDPRRDLAMPRLERGPVDDEPRRHVGDALDLDQPVRLEGGAGGHEIDDAAAQTKRRRQFDRAIELDAFGLHAPRGEMLARDLRVLGRDAHMAPAPRIVA